MDFIERLLHISPDGGNGSLEFMFVAAILLAFIAAVAVQLRDHFPRNFIKYLEQLGKREGSDRFDN
jgi:hypothetical protein